MSLEKIINDAWENKDQVNQNSDLNEWDGGQLGVIVEFESNAAAQKAFNSSEFQEYIKYSGIENQLSLSIIG